MIREVLGLIILAVLALAQPTEDARPLLRGIAEAAGSAKGWQAEGVSLMEMTSDGTHTTMETRFKMAKQGPLHSRYEANGAGATVSVCDGEAQWIYFQRAGFHTRNPIGDRCVPPVVRWDNLMDSLTSAVVTGREQVEFEGSMRPCDVVRAEYDSTTPLIPGTPIYGKSVRTLCIDPVSKLILRDHLEAAPNAGAFMRTSMTITYSKVERDPQLAADVFQFVPPAGSFLQQTFQNPAAAAPPAPGPGVYRAGNGVTAPTITSRIEPEYSEAARKEKISGTAVMSVEVGLDGVPRNITAVRMLGYGLDQKAAEAIAAWRFRPGMKDGKAVIVQCQIEVNFSLLNGAKR